MLTPETILQGRYRIIRQLGQGGMGAVYEAIDERLDTTVALKETLFTDERLRRQFEREARLLARLHHPALPRVSDHFSEGDGQFLVMQYIAGHDLAEMMTARQGPFPASQVLTWADQLLDALDYLHTQEPQIIHRDIKPQNLKLTSRGQIILLDFGLAKGQGGDISRITAASIFGYTPNYAPLEQIQGLGTDPRSDLYSLAATLYHLLTGVKPPDALTRAAALVNGQPDPLLPPSEASNAVDPSIDQVLKRALAQSRDQRFSTAADMRKALLAKDQVATIRDRAEAQTVLFPPTAAPTVASATDVIERQPTVATGETTVVRPAALVGRNRRGLPWAISIAALVLVAAGVLGFVALKWRRAPVDVVNPTPVESPTVAPTATPVETIAETQTPEPLKPQPTPEVRKSEKAETRKPAPKPSVEAGEEEETEQHDTQVHPEPAVPDVPPPTNLPRKPTTKVLPGGVVIRTFPDGTQILTMPDGTRVFTTPDGKRQVVKPRVYRRRTSPQPQPQPQP